MFDPSIFREHPQTPRQLRFGGCVMLPLGVFLLAGAITFAWLLLGVPMPAEWLPAGTRVEGVPGEGLEGWQRVALFALTGWLFAVAFVTITLGAWQLLLARPNRLLVRATIWLTVAIWIVGGAASVMSGCPVGRICQ
jgi:hypothetical protein